jgi:hypothetical protein
MDNAVSRVDIGAFEVTTLEILWVKVLISDYQS